MHKIETISLLPILNSCGSPTVEAKLTLSGSCVGIGSTGMPLVPGKKEGRPSSVESLHLPALRQLKDKLLDELAGQSFHTFQDFDHFLLAFDAKFDVGTQVVLALSIAFSRAVAATRGCSLNSFWTATEHKTGRAEQFRIRPLINMISGGIHAPDSAIPFQQIMILPENPGGASILAEGIYVYEVLENALKKSGAFRCYSRSSGMVTSLNWTQAFRIVQDALAESGVKGWGIGVDVAAEHLLNNGAYCCGDKRSSPVSMAEWIAKLQEEFNLSYIEDPLASEHSECLGELKDRLGPSCIVAGDDLFVSNSKLLDTRIASCCVIKLTQARVISEALTAARESRERGMSRCVSHRSCETEDSAMCDFASAIGAELIKIGGPRRGDRTVKFNQLMRLMEGVA